MPSIVLNARHANPSWLSFRQHILWLNVLCERCANWVEQLAPCTHRLSPRATEHIQVYPRFHFLAPERTGWQKKERTEPHDAWICISNSVRCVHVNPNDLTSPEEFSKFRGHVCLVLECIQEPARWKGVETSVKLIEDNSWHAHIFPGKLSGRDMRLFTNHYVRLVNTSDTVGKRNALMDALRIRISPWQLLYRSMKEV